MEDSFKVRVDRAFGSLEALASSSSAPIQSTPPSSSLWCLTDEEIERNKWGLQDKAADTQKKQDEHIYRLKNPKPYSPFLQGFVSSEPQTFNQDLQSDIQDLDDDDDDEEDDDQNLSKPEDHTNEEWDIRSSVGMDCTLDNEEEEDSFDKVAVGKEESANRFYMKEVNDYEVDIDSTDELPTSYTDVTRDPRANHMAAKLRLKEDDDSARKSGLQGDIQESDQIVTQESNQQLVMNEPPRSKAAPQSVPDYVRNPSRYTHYTFDSMDNADEESNRKAYLDLFNSLKGSAAMEIQDDVSTDTLTSVVFTPRKKSSDVSMKEIKADGNERKKAVPVSIAADSDEVCVMDEDEPTVKSSSSLQKSGRRYRTKGTTDVE